MIHRTNHPMFDRTFPSAVQNAEGDLTALSQSSSGSNAPGELPLLPAAPTSALETSGEGGELRGWKKKKKNAATAIHPHRSEAEGQFPRRRQHVSEGGCLFSLADTLTVRKGRQL